MKNLKALERDRLIYEFAILYQPFELLAQAGAPPDLGDYRIAVAKVQSGDAIWRQSAMNFVTFAKDVVFNQEYQDISHVPERFGRWLKDVLNGIIIDTLPTLHDAFKTKLAESKATFFEYVDRVPVAWEPVLFDANTPFTSYLRIREALTPAKQRIDYFDRYLKADFFALFLRTVPRSVVIRLVTTRAGVTDVTAISALAAKEFADYRLVEIDPALLHDRNLRVYNLVFNLGPGIDRAGMALTNFGPSDNSAAAHAALDSIIAAGRSVH
jgi:hypothetical protein